MSKIIEVIDGDSRTISVYQDGNDKLDEMWAALEAHQPRADKRGYGREWRVMCAKRTPEAARAAAWAAQRCVSADAEDAAWAAADAAWTAMVTAKASAEWAADAIKNIAKAEEPKP